MLNSNLYCIFEFVMTNRNRKMKKYIVFLVSMLIAFGVNAQTSKQAEKLFNNGDYQKAKEAYSKLIRTAPSNAGYNFFLGASLYELGEKDAAQPYLEKSAQRKYINAYRYLGKLYADLYRYDDAIENYETHIEWLIEKNRDTEEAENELSVIRQHARMFKGTEQVTVIDSFIVAKNDFLNSYKISKESGKIMMNPDITGVMYENEMGNKRIFSNLTDSMEMHLFTQVKLLDGWSTPEEITSLSDIGNVDYPYLMGDGTTLYFASDNEESLGGYDIYITRYDSEDNEYLRPSNIGMPFNSTSNDYMLAIDEFNNLGWFATDRYQPEDTVCIYVFIPNESKRTYNYENTDLQTMIDAATLQNISKTWVDMNEVEDAKNRLAKALANQNVNKEKKNFTFIINDQYTYHSLNDFRSNEARNLYVQLTSKMKELQQLEQNLLQMRDQYATGNAQIKKNLTPTILKLEKQIPQLIKETEDMTIKVRSLEVPKIKK